MEEATLSPFNRKIYDETLALLTEARRHAVDTIAERDDRRTAAEGLGIVGEQLRVTAWLASVMAWLLDETAGGADDDEPADPEGRLHQVGERRPDAMHLPPALGDLADRSHRIYARVSRLDAMMQAGRPAILA